MNRILLKDAALVTPERIIRKDLLIEGKFIAKIAGDIGAPGARIIDCHELLALPGMIDEHVHFREPGFPRKGTIYSESRAAVLGGVTSFMDMPNTSPPTLTGRDLEAKKAVAARDSAANYGFYLGATGSSLEELKRVPPSAYAAVKIFMGATTGDLLVDRVDQLARIFTAAPTLICAHCEDPALTAAAERACRARYGDAIPFGLHPVIRGRDACLKSASLAVELALASGARLHLMHVSTREEVALLERYVYGTPRTRQISGEAAVPHLFFSESDYARLGGFLKCNPAVKTEADRRAVTDALERGVLTTAGTDHAPHALEEKSGDYRRCASGVPSIQYALLSLLDLWKRSELSLETVARVSAQNVAERYRVPRRGRIEEGFYADLALINPLKPHAVSREDIYSPCGHSPFAGHTFRCSVEHTLVNGALAVCGGKLCAEAPGLPLEFDR